MIEKIDRRHLTPEAITEYGTEYANHPSHVLIVPDFLTTATSTAVSRFLMNQASWRTTYHINSRGSVDRDAWDAAPIDDRFFSAGLLESDVVEAADGPDADTYREMIGTFQSADFLRWLEAITSFQLDRLGLIARAFRKGESASLHIDDDGARRLAWTLYLTPNWRPSLGGILFMLGRGGDVTPVPAAFNSLVLFDATVHTLHRVTTISEDAGERARISVGGWVSGDGPPA